MMRKTLILLIIVLTSNLIEAQFIKEKSINAEIGYGLTFPNESATNIAGDGFFAQGEFVMKVATWFEIRPYAGFVLVNSNGEDQYGFLTSEHVETKAFLLGGKARLRAPIPWVAPYLEIGIGTSMGKFVTQTAYHNIDKSGIIYHIPFSLGLELGKAHNVDVGLTYYFQPTVEQTTGALAVGLVFPLKN